MKRDPYQVLKIDKGASPLEIEQAYHKSMLNYGFDPRVSYSSEEREKILRTITEIEEAYHLLSSNFEEEDRRRPGLGGQQKNAGEPEGASGRSQKKGFDLSAKGVYDQFFGLKERPFNLTPDTKYFYLSSKHKEALAHLFFGLQEQKGFVVITGEVGTGKTILCRSFLTQLNDESIKVALIFNPCLTDVELLQSINSEFGLASGKTSKKELLEDFNAFLLEARRRGQKVVLVIDEAQDLEIPTLEQLRLLSNLETETEKLLQVVLVGQPELLASLRDHKLRQLEQRITVRWSLSPLDFKETSAYIRHRLKIARNWGKVEFTNGAIRRIYKASQGIPRMINVLSDRALLVAYTLGRKSINRRIAALAISNYYQGTRPPSKPFPRSAGMAITLLLALFFSLYIGPWGSGYMKTLDMEGVVAKAKERTHMEEISSFFRDSLTLVFPSSPRGAPEIGAPALLPEREKPAKEEASPASAAKVEPPVASAPKAAPTVAAPPQGQPPLPIAKPEEAPVPAEAVMETVKEESPPPVAEISSKETEDDLFQTLTLQSLEESRFHAFNTLLISWKAPPISETEANTRLEESLKERNLFLLPFEGDFEKIKEMNCPVILELFFSPEVGERYLAVVGVSGETLLSGLEREQAYPFSQAKELWSGKGFILWKDFEKLDYNLALGGRGPQIIWLQEGLGKLGFFKTRKTAYFGEVTRQAVLAFQKSHRLMEDGVVGPEMKLKLYQRLGYEVPTLGVKP